MKVQQFVNLTPHPVTVIHETGFVGLEKLNATTWIADSCAGQPLAEFPSSGIARVSTSTVECNPTYDGILMVETKYGEVEGIPEGLPEDVLLIVSLPTLSMARQSGHPLASRMVSPYKVVRQRGNTSTVFGCMGFSK